MKSLINIENSFNRRERSWGKVDSNLIGDSTLNNNKNVTEISSMNTGSFVTGQFQDNYNFIAHEKSNNSFLRDLLIGVISGAIGTIIGALFMYFIFDIG